jgi:hypothetical protein
VLLKPGPFRRPGDLPTLGDESGIFGERAGHVFMEPLTRLESQEAKREQDASGKDDRPAE